MISVLVFCLGACAVDVGDDAADGTSEITVRGDELTRLDDGKQTNACPRQPDGACIDQFLEHTCVFVCCSGAQRSVRAVCGECNARASSWCGSGVQHTFWTF